jgi:hypothetical protein
LTSFLSGDILKTNRKPIAIAALLFSLYIRPSFAQTEGEHITTSAAHPVAAIQDTETAAQRDARMAWWREARFGMFIHWGLYSIPAGTWNGEQVSGIGEWIMNRGSIPVADYKALASKFNPTAFSAHDIVALAKSAGMKYIVITAKHQVALPCSTQRQILSTLWQRPHSTEIDSRVGGGVQEARRQAWILLLAGPGLDGTRRCRLLGRPSPDAHLLGFTVDGLPFSIQAARVRNQHSARKINDDEEIRNGDRNKARV